MSITRFLLNKLCFKALFIFKNQELYFMNVKFCLSYLETD